MLSSTILTLRISTFLATTLYLFCPTTASFKCNSGNCVSSGKCLSRNYNHCLSRPMVSILWIEMDEVGRSCPYQIRKLGNGISSRLASEYHRCLASAKYWIFTRVVVAYNKAHSQREDWLMRPVFKDLQGKAAWNESVLLCISIIS